MKKTRDIILKYFFIVCFSGWLLITCQNMIFEIKRVGKEVQRYWGLSEDEKREKMYPNFYKFVKYCKQKVPEDSTIFVKSTEGYLGFHYYYFSYHLYPRRILINSPDQQIGIYYWLNKIKFIPTAKWLKSNNVSYIIKFEEHRFPGPFDDSKDEFRLIKIK
ncbi:MAG: hypothetical protein M1155_00385 [Patescibacteria group bacterium]|nr:hypothetical protein [Patescibacteria group bacterium]